MIFSILTTCQPDILLIFERKKYFSINFGNIKTLHLYTQNIDSPCQNNEFALVVSHLFDSFQYYENCKALYLEFT